MKLSGLLGLLRRSARFLELVEAARRGGATRVQLPDPAKTYLTAALAREIGVPLLVVVPTATRSRVVVEALRAWLSDGRPVELLAERDALPYESIAADPLTRQARLRALTALVGEATPIIVTTGRALMDRVAHPQEFSARFLELQVGSASDPTHLAEHLLEAGYEPAPLVEVPGTFSRRGGILDVFPPATGEATRIEFFGDEIDTIRVFDPLSQRSGENRDGVRLSPAAELFPRGHLSGLDAVARADVAGLTESARAVWQRELERLRGGGASEALDLIAGHLSDVGPLAYLPPDGLLVIEEPESVQTAVEQIEAQAEDLFAELQQKRELPPGIARPYAGWTDLGTRLAARDRVELTWRATAENDHSTPPPDVGSREGVVDFGGVLATVTPYGGRVRVVLDDVEGALRKGERVVLVTQQDARLTELFVERGLSVHQTGDLLELPPKGALVSVHGAAVEGLRVVGAPDGDLTLLSDLEIFGWTKPRRSMRPRASARDTFLSDVAAGDYVVHVEHGVGRYGGLVRMGADGVEREYLRIDYAESDRLFVPTDQADRVSRYVGPGDSAPTLHRLGGTEWARTKSRVKAAVQEMAQELLELYATREVAEGHAFAPDSVWQSELETSFPYVETPDQLTAIEAVKNDMERPRPMDRLLCGDVGYGKTEVALRAAFKAVMDGKQVAILVPTTVLAQQHFNTFRERLQAFPVSIEMLSRFRSAREQSNVIARLAQGSVDVVIGTHRLLQKDVGFKDLGLVIIDEEQRFGVSHKERLKQLRREVDVLTLTATPIPRTLHMALAGVRDMSTMETAPEHRLPVRTYVQAWDDGVVREAILREIDRGGQVYFVHNRVQTIGQQAQRVQALVPTARILVGHGQMAEDELERVMVEFAAGRADVLVCTTIIESGLDIPNVNTILVNNADAMGLAQLYQLRGRVGRGTNRAYAYFLFGRGAQLSEVSEKRLRTIAEATELGAGFHIAMKDLEIRGAGNLLGAQQSGHVAAVGFHLYTQMLGEAVEDLRARQEGRPAPVADPRAEVVVDLPVDALIPSDYVSDESSRLSVYRRLAGAASLEAVGEIAAELRDRYGPLPEPVLALLWLVQVKQLAADAGVVAVTATEGEIVLRFATEQPGRLKALEPRFAPYFRAGRAYAFLDRVGLGRRWQETLERALESLALGSRTALAAAR